MTMRKDYSYHSAEVIEALSGSVRWVMDLIAWLTDNLFSLPNTCPADMDLTNLEKLSLVDLAAHLHDTNNVALHLILASSTRGFLHACIRRMTTLEYFARKAIALSLENNGTKTHLSPGLPAAYIQLAFVIGQGAVRLTTFQTLLTSLSAKIKSAYAASTNPLLTSSPAAEALRNDFELKMLFGGPLPPSLAPVIVELYTGLEVLGSGDGVVRSRIIGDPSNKGLLQQVRTEIDSAKLWFTDFTLLEVEEDAYSVRQRRAQARTIDCFRKIWLPAAIGSSTKKSSPALPLPLPLPSTTTLRLRRCARCTATMEELMTSRPALQWLVMQQRRCFCGGFWTTVMETRAAG